MEEIEYRDEDEGNPDKDEVVVLDDPSRFPDKEKNCSGDSNRGELDRGMEECKIIPAHCKEKADNKNEEDPRNEVLLQV
jgi:hypothetical protein